MQQAVHTPCFLDIYSLIPDHQIWECRVNLIHQQIFMGILDHKKFCTKNLNQILQHKNFTAQKFPGLQYVCVCMCPTWRVVCICVCASYMVVVDSMFSMSDKLSLLPQYMPTAFFHSLLNVSSSTAVW